MRQDLTIAQRLRHKRDLACQRNEAAFRDRFRKLQEALDEEVHARIVDKECIAKLKGELVICECGRVKADHRYWGVGCGPNNRCNCFTPAKAAKEEE